ncbi:MAG TPA: heme exporter protein CcmD [Xanthomonadaceae bacterium]|nr:heme exporter protein CcmD [Xanthomonadaceae bacterium]
MNELLSEGLSHTPFIIASYIVFFVVLLADAVYPWIARRRLVRDLNTRWRRERVRQEKT